MKRYPGSISTNSIPSIVRVLPVGPPVGGKPYFRIRRIGGQSLISQTMVVTPTRRKSAARIRTVRFFGRRI